MNTFEVYPNYYINNKIKYIISFPIVWLSKEIDCIDCKKYGMFDDIFYFYCKNCLDEKYAGSRGNSKILNMDNIEKISPDIFEQFVNFYYENFNNYSEINSLINCYGCYDELSLNEILLEQHKQFIITNEPHKFEPHKFEPHKLEPHKLESHKLVQILCPECRNFPDHESWPPLGT